MPLTVRTDSSGVVVQPRPRSAGRSRRTRSGPRRNPDGSQAWISHVVAGSMPTSGTPMCLVVVGQLLVLPVAGLPGGRDVHYGAGKAGHVVQELVVSGDGDLMTVDHAQGRV